MEPLISVIVPVYNVQDYVAKCVESITNQTYSNLEIILVDDGSTDKSGIICDEIAKEDKRIRVIHKNNGGLSDARNRGLDVATGEYIAFVDSDDYINKNMYEILMRNLRKDKADISMCGYKMVKDYTNSDDKAEYDLYANCKVNANNIESIVYKSKKEKLNCIFPSKIRFIVMWNKIYSKNIWKSIRFPKGEVYEDEQLFYKIIYNCKRITVCEEKMYNYVQRDNSITSNNITMKIKYKIDAYENKYYYFLRKGEYEASKSALFEWKSLLVDSYCKNAIFKKGKEKKHIQKMLNQKKKRFINDFFIKKNYKMIKCKEIKSYILFMFFTRIYIECFKNKHRNIYSN